MYNRVILVGRLTRDIELRYTQNGKPVASVGIATNRRWKGQNGQTEEETMFIDLSFFGRLAEIANQYLHKGSKVLVEGHLKLEQWTDRQGQRRSKHSVSVESMQMLDSKPSNQGGGYNNQPQNRQQNKAPRTVPEIDIDDDEVPF